MDEMQLRMEALERANRRCRAGMLALLIAAAGAMVMGLARQPGTPEVLRAKRFEVVNDAGVALVTLTQNDAGGIIATQTQTGQILVTVTATRSGEGVVAVADRDGRRLVELSGKPGEGVGVVNTFAETGQVAVTLMSARGGGIVQAFEGQRPAAMLGSVDGEGVIAVFDAQGQVAQTVPPGRK